MNQRTVKVTRMNITRRTFLCATAATATNALARPLQAAMSPPTLTARPGLADLGHPSGAKTPIWGYEAAAPGPTLRLKQGTRLIRKFINALPQPSTVHWHGIRIANAMDGVPDLTQPLVQPGGDFLYDFTVPDAGTFWYHPHNRTWEQLARGLYGALVVEEADPPAVDRDDVLLIDDWRLDDQGSLNEPTFGAISDWAHGGRLGNWVTINGRADYTATVKHNERLRLRLVNTANARIFTLGVKGLNGWVVALDGQPLAAPAPIELITLAPAQRADLIVDVTAETGGEAVLFATARDRHIVIGSLKVLNQQRPARLPAPAPLAPNPVPGLGDVKSARRVKLHMQGGAMGGMRRASFEGKQLSMRDLVARGRLWAFNGVTDMPKAPLVDARPGETIRLAMHNDTAWPHAMHLHGHHFREVKADDRLGPLRDTLLVARNKTAEIAFLADNPGKWLFHCHMVEHAASGMMTWINVAT